MDGYTPVNEGDELDVKIEAVGDKGDGICRKQGFVLVVPGTKKGERVRIKVTKVLKSVGFAQVIGQIKGPEKAKVDEADIDAIEDMEKKPKDDLPPPGDPIYTEDF